LVLLQKTLLNIEGLGRQLDPDLDLWVTAKPILERWMNEQVGWRGFMAEVQDEAPQWARLMPQVPRLAHQALLKLSQDPPEQKLAPILERLVAEQRSTRRWLMALSVLVLLMTGLFFAPVIFSMFVPGH
jgi:ubiquinone biosynthesis protein